MIQQPQIPTQQEKPKATVTGLENIDLRDVPAIRLQDLEPGTGYKLTVLGWVSTSGQYGPYYILGVQDDNGSIFKIFTNSQLTKLIDGNHIEIGKKYWFVMKLKPGMTYDTKEGPKEVKGYIYDVKEAQD